MSHVIHQVVPVLQSTINNEEVLSVDARDLHHALKAGRDFSPWINGRISDCGFVEGEDYVMFEDLRVPDSAPSKARPQYRKEYRLSLDMAKHLCMLERNPTGHAVRQGFIDYEKQTRQLIANPQNFLPTDPMQVLRLTFQAIEQQEQRIANVEGEIEDMKNSQPVQSHQRYSIQKAVGEKVQQLSEKHQIAYRPILFSATYGFVKRHFKVPTYSAIPAIRFEEALSIIKNLVLEQLPENVAAMARGGVV